MYHGWFRLCLSADGSTATAGEWGAPAPGHLPFWFKPVSAFGLLEITKRIVSKVPGNELRDSRTALAALWIQSVELNRRGSIGYGDSIEGMNLGVGLRGVGVSREYGLRLDRDP
jgi:hypothetical protein